MGTIPLALSVHHFISSVGADAGFAAIIGLAILILLYFSQARETATLRDHAHEAADRIQQLEARVAQLTRGGGGEPSAPAEASAAPVRAPAPASAVAARPAPTPSEPSPPPRPASRNPEPGPGAPAGMGAPALSAATRLIPTAAPVGAVALASDPPGGASTVQAEPSITARDKRPGPRPATVAGAANGASREQSRSAAGAAAAPPPRVPVGPVGSPPTRRPSPPARARQPQDDGPNLLLIGGLAAAGIVAVVVLLVVLTSSGNSSSKTQASSNTNAQSRRAHKSAVNPSSVTVAVLNGTSTPGLAGSIATKLSGKGFKQGTVATASDQTATTTTVAYLPGFRRDAMSVATTLKVGPGSVQPVQQAAQAVACPPPAACPANVVVTVGSDLTSTQ